MKGALPIKTLFLDIGGVLLTDGWDHHARRRAAKTFTLDRAEMEERHLLNFATYEAGKLTLREYLARVVFYQKRAFTQAQFRRFLFAQSKPFPAMLDLGPEAQGKVWIEDRGAQQRSAGIECVSDSQVQVGRICGCFRVVLLRPPAQARCRHLSACARHRPDVSPASRLYREHPDVRADAESLGIRGLVHTDYRSTRAKLALLGLRDDEEAVHEPR